MSKIFIMFIAYILLYLLVTQLSTN